MNSVILDSNRVYTEEEIINVIRTLNPSVSDVHIKWVLFEMQKNKQITRVGCGKYVSGRGKEYIPISESDVTKDIAATFDNTFPLLKIVIWETFQLNEWINLLLSKNIIFVEVESGFESIIFEKLISAFGNKYLVLLNPDNEMISKYMRNDLIVVKTLFSRSPVNKNNRNIMLEKLVVDVIADKYLSSVLGTNNIECVIRGIKNNYIINVSKMFTYARRRNKEKELKDIWENSEANNLLVDPK